MKILRGIFCLLVFASLSATIAFSPKAYSQDSDSSYRKTKFISLTIGIEHDEKLPPLPEDVKFPPQGDFKKVTAASYAKDINVIRFTPRSEGVATLTIHDSKGRIVAEYRIDVRKSKLDRVAYEMQSLLGDIEGIAIKVMNNKVLVDGQIILPKDLNRIASVVGQYGDQAASLVSLSPIAMRKIAEMISRDINNPEIEVRAVNEAIVLQGTVNTEADKTRALDIAKLYLPDLIKSEAEKQDLVRKRKLAGENGLVDLISVKAAPPPAPKKAIQVVLHYVELKKDYGKGFRFQFTPSLKDGSSMSFGTSSNAPGNIVTTLTATIDNLLPKLNWAKQHGHARILQSSSLMVEEGKKGTINNTRSILFQTTTSSGQSTAQSTDVGLKTAVTASIQGERSDSVALDLEFWIASLLGSNNGLPETAKNEIQTSVTIRSGQSAAIGGLIANSTSTDYNKMPKNGDSNPILSIYASKAFQKDQSQFVVFVTPIIKSSASAGSEKVKKKFRLRD
jgi:pilus assembly protein CpaC